MKLNSIIFCLCAGLSSSAVLDNAFSMNNKGEDGRGLYIGINALNDNGVLRIYGTADMDLLRCAIKNSVYETELCNLDKIEIYAEITDKKALKMLNVFKLLSEANKVSAPKVTFYNVVLERPELLGKFDENGGYTFNQNVYSTGDINCANLVVTKIGDNAFWNNDKLISINIPDSVKKIGSNALGRCKNLIEVNIPDSVEHIMNEAFTSCLKLSKLTIGKNVKEIGYGTFYLCNALNEITLPDSIVSVGCNVLSDCKNLENVVCNDKVKDLVIKNNQYLADKIGATRHMPLHYIYLEAKERFDNRKKQIQHEKRADRQLFRANNPEYVDLFDAYSDIHQDDQKEYEKSLKAAIDWFKGINQKNANSGK